MCGIFGCINFDQGENIKEEILLDMGAAIKHRGPDGDGYYIKDNIGLGHNRLAIIDLETGAQPLSNEDGTIFVLCNGEIYNYKSLTEELRRKGHEFKSRTDAEVLVHLYEDEGIGCLRRISGMFSFALWDSRDKKLFLVRDRLGIKPLYYKEERGGLVFASEIKSVLNHPSVNKGLDFISLRYYFLYGYVPDPMSIFEGIKKIPPATYLCFSEGKSSLKTYWIPTQRQISGDGEKAITDRLFSLLENAVQSHLMSDVPLGIFLSGGLDSSIIAYLAARESKEKIMAFSISFDDREYDESGYARLLTKSINLNYLERKISSEDIIRNARAIVSKLDEPLADSSFIPTYLLSSFAKEHVKVCLSGDGGDELFAGYPTYLAQPVADIYRRVPRCIREGVFQRAVGRIPVQNSNNKMDFILGVFIKGVDYEDIERNIIWFGPLVPGEINNLLKKEIRCSQSKEDLFMVVKDYVKSHNIHGKLSKYLLVDRRFYLGGDILVKTDRASMANSLEVRVPYLDLELVEFVDRLPEKLKLRLFTSKYILKKTFLGKLPSQILRRRKQGFNIAIGRLLKKGLLDEFSDLLTEDIIRRQGIFEYRYIENIISEHLHSKKDNRRAIWSIIVFQVWYSKYIGLR